MKTLELQALQHHALKLAQETNEDLDTKRGWLQLAVLAEIASSLRDIAENLPIAGRGI